MTTNLQQYCSICTLLNLTHSKVMAVRTTNNEQKTLRPLGGITVEDVLFVYEYISCTGAGGRL